MKKHQTWLATALSLVLLTTACSNAGLVSYEDGDVVLTEEHAWEAEFPLKENMVENASKRFQSLYNSYIKGTECDVYYSIIPDKGYFLASKDKSMDYEKLVTTMTKSLSNMTYLDIFPYMSLSDYYYSDSHWKQEELFDVADFYTSKMQGTSALSADAYELISAENPFYGAYYSKQPEVSPDTLVYAMHENFASCTVTSYASGAPVTTSMYTMDKLTSENLYDVYLGGADPLIVIENPNATSDEELIIFRDSFCSSLAPLLVNNYAKITLVDIRYLRSATIGEYLTFTNQDVLFLYSTLLLNNSTGLK